MKIKSLNTQKREIVIISASILMFLILVLIVFLFSRSLAKKIEIVYSNQTGSSAHNKTAKIEEYNEIIKAIYPSRPPVQDSPTPSSSPSSTLTEE